LQEEYTLTPPGGALDEALRVAMRAWLRERLPVPGLEREGDLWYLFSDEDTRGAVLRALEARPSAPLYAYAAIRIRPTHVQLATVRDPVTDGALRDFAEWAMAQAELILAEDGSPISPEDLVDPELYE
jgi:hypothetical protein